MGNKRGTLIVRALLIIAEVILVLVSIGGLFGKDAVYHYNIADMNIVHGKLLEDGNSIRVDSSSGFSGEAVRLENLSLPSGVYRVELDYETDTDMKNICQVTDQSIYYKNLLTNGEHLYSGLSSTGFDMWLKEDSDRLTVSVNFGGQGSMTVKGLTIYETNAMARIYLFLVICACMVIDAVYFLVQRHKRKPFAQKTINVAVGLTAVIIMASYPLMTDVIIYGGDTVFHLLRVEGIKDALFSGQFPARIAPEWQQGHGYASSVFYGETLLYIQAFFRMIGFTVLTSYRMFQFLMVVATVLVSYYAFRKMFGEPYVGLICSMLYSMSVYRIYKTYQVGAYGETCAILFLPLIAYGFFRVFTEDIHTKEYKRSWIPLTIGFSGLVQSHMLSGELTGAFTILLCIILWKKVFRKETFTVLAKTVIYTCIFSGWFLLPFIDYMLTGDFQVQHVSGRTIQERGLYPAHLLRTFVTSGGNVWFEDTAMKDSDPQTVGISLLFGLGVWLLIRISGKKRSVSDAEWNTGRIAGLFSVLAMIFSLSVFPWNKLHFINQVTATLISSLEFPHRFLTIATVSLTVVCGVVAKWLWNGDRQCEEAGEKRKYLPVYGMIMAGLLCVSSVYLMNDLLNKGNFVRIYNCEGMSTGYVSSGEYLPHGTDTTQLMYKDVIAEDNIKIRSYHKKGLSTQTVCTNNSNREGFLQFPMLYYKGYIAREKETGKRLPLYDGNNHMVSVAVPAGFEGNVSVEFVSPWYWRVAEVISLTAFVIFVIYIWYGRFGKCLQLEKRLKIFQKRHREE